MIEPCHLVQSKLGSESAVPGSTRNSSRCSFSRKLLLGRAFHSSDEKHSGQEFISLILLGPCRDAPRERTGYSSFWAM